MFQLSKQPAALCRVRRPALKQMLQIRGSHRHHVMITPWDGRSPELLTAFMKEAAGEACMLGLCILEFFAKLQVAAQLAQC